MRKCVSLVVVGVMLAGCQSTMEQAAADDGSAPLRPSFDQCIERAEAVTPAMQDCIEAEFVFQNGRMEAALAKLMPAIAGDQQVWLERKDAECRWDAKTEGQGQRIDANYCSLERIALRATELEERVGR